MTKSTQQRGWHFTNGNKLRDGRLIPAVGEWLNHTGPVVICELGLHYSVRLIDALRYAPGCTLHRVTVDGIVHAQEDKGVARHRSIDASADMLWPLVQFAEWCAQRAAAADARYAAANAARYAADADACYAAAAARYAADAARYAADADANAERGWQNEVLELLFDAVTDQHREMMQ